MRYLLLHHSPETLTELAKSLNGVHLSTKPLAGKWDILLRLGESGDAKSLHTLNPLPNCKNARDKEIMRDLLKINGLRYSSKPMSSRVYRTYTLDLMCIAIFKRDNKGIYHHLRSVPYNRRKKLQRIAQRALYALRLHYGACDICLDKQGQGSIINIDPSPPIPSCITKEIARGLMSYINKLSTTLNKSPGISTVILGADPEFVVKDRSSRKLRYASDHFPPDGSVGFDVMRLKVNGIPKHPTGEIRPAPAKNPKELLANIQEELLKAIRLLPDLDTCWLAGSTPHPGVYTGGHIHFSNIPLSTDFLKALDNYLAIPTLLMENAETARIRRKVYGFLGEYRPKEHGGIEYRTLSSWLTSPRRARITLCLAKIVAEEYPRLKQDLLTTVESQKAFYQANKEYFRGKFPDLWRDICSTETYKEYRNDIEPVFYWIMEKRRWRENGDFKRQWVLNCPSN